jgi:cytoskeletal protein CcmA (bactofilin family)
VLGTVEGRIETTSLVVEEGARVNADVVADEVVIAGEYGGNLTCRRRLEIRSTGRVSGHVETYRLMLHEGASLDGDMRMLKEATSDGETRPGGVRSAPTGLTPRGAGAVAPAAVAASPGSDPIG